jgi:hypothetical protein
MTASASRNIPMTRLIKPLKPADPRQKQQTARIALVQIDYNPAYKYKIDYLSEPVGIDVANDAAVTTLSLTDRSMETIVRSEIALARDAYVTHLKKKLTKILESLTGLGVDVVVFPEYSIPSEIVKDLMPFAATSALVLPSHTATTLSLKQLGELFGDAQISFLPGHCLFVVLPKGDSGEAYLLGKLTRSQFESSLTPADQTALLPLCGEDNPVLVLMCSDFLQGRDLVPGTGRPNPALPLIDLAALRIVCSLTPNTGPFFELATADMLRSFSVARRPTAFVNHANKGGTSLFAIMEDEQVLEPHDKYSSYRLPPNVEAVAVYDVALGPQLDVKPSPLSPPDLSRLVALKVLKTAESPAGFRGSLQSIAVARTTASNGVIANIDRSFELLRDVISDDVKAQFAPIELSVDESTLWWRSNTARSFAEVLRSLIPSVDTRDRQLIEGRVDALESFAGKNEVLPSQPASPMTGVAGETEPIEVEEADASGVTSLRSVVRLTSLPRTAQLEDIIGPIWSLVQTVVDDPLLTLEVRYDVMRAADVDVAEILTEFSIEMFIIARYRFTDHSERERGRATLRDIRLLLQMGFGETYRFSPVSQALAERYRKSQELNYRVHAGHSLVQREGKSYLVPYRSQPRIETILRFLFSRGERASLILSLSAGALEGLQFDPPPPVAPFAFPVQPVPSKAERSLSDALRILDLIRTLRPSTGDPSDTPFCRLDLSLELPGAPSALVPEVVFRELLGDVYEAVAEQRSDQVWSGVTATTSPNNIVSLRECLTLMLFPIGHLPTFGDRTSAGVLQVPMEVVENRQGTMIGHAFHQDAPNSIPVYLPDEDRRKHVYVIGKTGVGKTQFLLNLIMQDIESGAGVCVIDPHGDLFEDILNRFPAKRVKDLVIFDPTDQENPPGLNLFEYDRRNPLHRDFVLDEAVAIFFRLHGNEMFGPRIQNYFRNAALALMGDPSRERTLLDLSRIFIDDEFYEYAMNASTDPAVADFISEFRKTADREKAEMIPYFQSKFTPFVSNSGIRNVIGQSRSTINFRQAMDLKRVVLVNLAKGKLGELNSRLLGMVMVGKVTWAALSRAHVTPDQRSDFYLYCDEFQNFATDTFSTILSESRKYGLCLMLANQFLSQLRINDNYTSADRDSLKDAVLGNVGNLVVFRVGASDAEQLVKEVAGDRAEKLAEVLSTQPRFQALARVDCGGRPTQPFTLKTVLTKSLVDRNRSGMLREYVAKEQLMSRDYVLSDIASSRADYRADGDYISESELEGEDSLASP